MKSKWLLIGAVCMAAGFTMQLSAQPAPAPAAGAPAGGRAPREYPANQNLTGRWISHTETTNAAGVKTVNDRIMDLVQMGNRVNGKSPPPAQPRPGIFSGERTIYGWMEGDEVTLQEDFDFDGGEHLRMHLTYKDGHLVGTLQVAHDAPHKYRLDTMSDVDFQKAS